MNKAFISILELKEVIEQISLELEYITTYNKNEEKNLKIAQAGGEKEDK